jgi:hypothetical protein
MNTLYLSRLDNNLGDIQSSVYRHRDVLNQEVARRNGVKSFELFPDGDLRDFAFPESWNLKGDSSRPGKTKSGYKLIVVGGGGLVGPPIFDAGWDALGETESPVVLWGIGHNVHLGRKPSLAFQRFIELNSSRTFVAFRDTCAEHYAPCPSVHEPMLSQLPGPQIKVPIAAYLHSNQPSPLWSKILPNIRNHNQSMKTVLNFLGSSGLNITNSYHGALWSRCLGRNTIVYKPFSDKFYCLPKATKHPWPSNRKNSNESYLQQLQEASFLKAMDLANWLGVGKP